MRKSLTINLFLLLFTCSVTAQKLEVNSVNPEKNSRLIITANKKGAEFKMDDSVAKMGMVFFSAGYQETIIAEKKTETYFIELDIVHNDNRLGCLQEFKSKAVLLLEDGTRIECFQISEFDCGREAFKAGFALVPYNRSPEKMKENFEKLKTTAIKSITVYTSATSMEFTVKPKMRDYLKSHFALIDKTLNAS